MHKPSISIKKRPHEIMIFSGRRYVGMSIGGTWFKKKPKTPNCFMPDSIPVTKVAAARAMVTENDAVGEPAQGTMPSKLHPRTKKKRVHSMGTKLSPR